MKPAGIAGVSPAVAYGQTVEAEAKGTVQGTQPFTVFAREVEFEIES